MSHLNKTLRAAMVKEMLAHAFDQPQADIEKAKLVAGDQLHNVVYGEHIKAMDSIPKGWMMRRQYIYANVGGQTRKIEFSEYKNIGYYHDQSSGDHKPFIESDHPDAIAYIKACDDLTDLKRERNVYERKIASTLDGIPTFKKLWEVWPESKGVFEKFEVKPAIAILPAVQLQDLNSKLGLPVDAQETTDE